MGISEAVIIYLAIGAPLGVYAIIRSRNSLKANLVGLLAANVLFWPIFPPLELVPRSESRHEPNYFVDGHSRSADDLEEAKATVNAPLDQIADRRARRAAHDAFERFAPLSHAALDTAEGSSISVPEIFAAAGHVNPVLAAKCLFRKNSAKLKGHYQRAEADLRSLADTFTSTDRSHFEATLADLAKAEIDLRDSSISSSVS